MTFGHIINYAQLSNSILHFSRVQYMSWISSSHTLIFAGNLAVVAAPITYGNINNKSLYVYLVPSVIQALKRRPEAGSYSRSNASGYSFFQSSISAMVIFCTSTR